MRVAFGYGKLGYLVGNTTSKVGSLCPSHAALELLSHFPVRMYLCLSACVMFCGKLAIVGNFTSKAGSLAQFSMRASPSPLLLLSFRCTNVCQLEMSCPLVS